MARASRPTASRHEPLRPARAKMAAAQVMASAWMDETAGRVLALQFQQERPEKLEDAIKKARYWVEKNWYVQGIIELRAAFFNFGFRLRPVDPEKRTSLKEWLEADDFANQRRLHDYVDETWLELLTTRNVIAVWQPGKSKRPLVLPPEECEYKDKFAVEELKIRHGLKAEEIRKERSWSEAMKKALLAGPTLTLRHQDESLFAFDVLKLQKLGQGLARPDLESVFQTCAQNESMETSDSLLAYIGRTIYEQHKMGAEYQSGSPPGWAALHSWNPKRSQAFERSIKGVIGHVKQTLSWDHNTEFVRPDQKGFDGVKYKAVTDRLAWWAMPLGQMLLARGVTPFLMELFEGQARRLRERMEGHLNRTINLAFDLPTSVRVQWSNRCFRDLRLATEMLKFGLQAGPISQTTFQENAGLDPAEERARKAQEAELPKAQTTPIYEPNQGGKKQEKGGRPAGTGDPTT